MSIIILLFSMILNGIFAMVEIALVSSRQTRLQQRADEGQRGAAAALELMEEPNRFLSTVQIGITLVGIFSGAFGAAQLSPPLAELLSRVSFLENSADEIAFASLVLIITYFSLVIGELIPKRVAINKPEAVASALAIPMRFLSKIAKPIVSVLSASSELGVRLLGIKPGNEPSITEEEIKVLIEEGQQHGIFKKEEREMISSVFRLGDRRVGALMTPRLEMAWIDINDPIDKIWTELQRTPYARIPVADGEIDDVLGYIQIKELLGQSPDDPEFDLHQFIKEPIFLPENIAALESLANFQTGGVHLAFVVDEYGGIIGMVTDYDILKAIVGDIPETSESTDYLAVQREDGSWLFDGLIVIDELKEILELKDMPPEAQSIYQTLSGLVMSQLGKIPKTGDVFEYEHYRFEVVDMDGRRVDRVLVTRIED